MKNKKLSALFIFYVIVFVMGFEKLFLNYQVENGNHTVYLLSFFGLFLCLIYLVPIFHFSTYFIKKFQDSTLFFLISFATGAFITVGLTADLNAYFEGIIGSHMAADTKEAWQYALASPWVEEIVKGIFALIVLLILNKKEKFHYFFSGIGIGLGFQFLEDFGYILPETMENGAMEKIIPNALNRISGSISSHWVYSAIFMVGIYYILREKNPRGILLMIFVVVVHFIWNSPLLGNAGESVLSPILTVITFVMFLRIGYDIIKEKEKMEINPKEEDEI